jgi:hypothetical protein
MSSLMLLMIVRIEMKGVRFIFCSVYYNTLWETQPAFYILVDFYPHLIDNIVYLYRYVLCNTTDSGSFLFP